MFTITSTRIVGLIAVVCAVIVAPQALATPSTHSQNATPTIIAPPDPDQGYDLSGFDLGDWQWQSPMGRPANNTPGGILPAYAANTLRSSGKAEVLANDTPAAMFVYMPTNPGWGAAATAAKRSAVVPAPALAVKTAPGWFCNGQTEYDHVYAGCE